MALPNHADPPPNRLIVTLIGYRCTGKTTVARLLAKRVAADWVDVDDVIEAKSGVTITEIFAKQGETAFRDLESAVIEELTRRHRTIIAAGGGSVLRPENRRAIKQAGPVVWLTAPAATIQERMQSDAITQTRRPRLTDAAPREEIERMLATRQPIYQSLADLTLSTEHDPPDAIAAKIATWLPRWVKSSDPAL